jgi:FtsP/CotA-like multicopper oxidase with cupredoxin domain
LGAALLAGAPATRLAGATSAPLTPADWPVKPVSIPVTTANAFQPYCPIQRLSDVIAQTSLTAQDSPILVEPEVRSSVNGVLDTTLNLRYAWRNVGKDRLFLRTYEGNSPGPTLRVQPGDTMRIKLVNDLPPDRDELPAQLNHPHHFNTTNFHFHGSHVSPQSISDNVLREMLPGQSYDIEIALPSDHTRGSYWYHPHHHGSADVQVASGMAGMIVVDGDFANVPEIASAKTRVLVFSEQLFDQYGMIEDFTTIFQEGTVRFFTINGQRYPTLQMQPGEVQRWRILHAGYQDDVALLLDSHDLNVIAWDGITNPRMETLLGPLVVAPGQRVDVLVKASATPGTYEMNGVAHDQGYPSPTGQIMRVVVAGDPLDMALPRSLPPQPLEPIRDSEITGKRQVVFSAVIPDAIGYVAALWQEYSFLIDGKQFDPNRVDQSIRLGSVEEWTITNLHNNDHVFHIHQNPFQVTAINGQPVAEPRWRDTEILPANGTLTFRSRFLDFTGRYVLHCHMMNHEDMGMMQLIEVY